MATLEEVAYNIQSILTGGESPNDPDVTISQIKFAVKYYRSLLIRRTIERNRNFNIFEHDLGILKVNVEQLGDSFDNNVVAYVTEKDIPNPLRLMGGRAAITFVGDPNKTTVFSYKEGYKAYYNRYSKYISKDPIAYYKDNKIYIINQKSLLAQESISKGELFSTDDLIDGLEEINVRGIFTDPEEVKKLTGDDDLKLPSDMISGLTSSVLKGEFSLLTQIPTDESQDMEENDNR